MRGELGGAPFQVVCMPLLHGRQGGEEGGALPDLGYGYALQFEGGEAGEGDGALAGEGEGVADGWVRVEGEYVVVEVWWGA